MSASPSPRRMCPWCGEKIRQAAIVCRFCQNDVTPQGEERARRIASGEEALSPPGESAPIASKEGGIGRLARYVPASLVHGIIEGAAAIEEGERRPIAVLFADLVGYTGLTEEHGAEVMSDLLQDLFLRIQSVVQRYDGLVEKAMGDAVMALFGAPRAHGDDAERAIRAALDIREAVKGLGRERRLELELHSGIAYGEVVYHGPQAGGGIEHQTIGGAVNLASRLQAMAKAGETLVDHRIYTQTRTTFTWSSREARG